MEFFCSAKNDFERAILKRFLVTLGELSKFSILLTAPLQGVPKS